MSKKFLLLFIILLFSFSSGCIQSSPSNVSKFINPVEENISEILATSANLQDVWNKLENAKIPEEIRYRPSPSGDKAWIIAEIDPINNTWIAIDVEQKEIFHEGENKSYFSGIPLKNYEDFQKELAKKAWTPSEFLPIHTTATTSTIVPTTIPTNPSNNSPFEINLTLIFLEALFSFIVGAILIYFIGFDLLDRLVYILFIIVLMGGGLALINHPSTDVVTITSELSSFFITWIMNVLVMALSGMFGSVIGAFAKMGTDIFTSIGIRGGRRGGRGGGGRGRR
jgi:hypothetical protein